MNGYTAVAAGCAQAHPRNQVGSGRDQRECVLPHPLNPAGRGQLGCARPHPLNPAGRGRDQRGSGTLLMVAVTAFAVVLAAGVAVVIGYAIATHRARAMADLSALSGATAVARGFDACTTAKAIADRNGVRLVECRLIGDQVEYVVSVRVEVDVGMVAPGLPRAVAAEAHGGRVSE